MSFSLLSLVWDVIDMLAPFQGHLPFAVVGSMDEVKVGNKMVKARQYPWGVVQGKGDLWGHVCLPDSLKAAFSASSEAMLIFGSD